MRKARIIVCFALVATFIVALCCSCQTKEKNIEKVNDLEFTVVPDANVPEELLQLIEQKKQSAFKLTFTSTGNEYLYIVVGYGQQNTGGYSISVDDLYLATNAIYIDTNLIGPKKDEPVIAAFTYPYVVVKIPYMDESVVFQ